MVFRILCLCVSFLYAHAPHGPSFYHTKIQHSLIIESLHQVCKKIKELISNDRARTCSCFISRAYPSPHDPIQMALNSWCNAFNHFLQSAGIQTIYDEFGSIALNHEIYPFIHQIGSANAVFPLLTPAFKTHTENRTGWLFDEVQCFTARRAKNPHGCYPILLAGTPKQSTPPELLPLENTYYYTIARSSDHIKIPWPTADAFVSVVLEILTPNDKGITRWVSKSARSEIETVIHSFKKNIPKPEQEMEVIPSAAMHELIAPSLGQFAKPLRIENVSHMIDSFFHQRKNAQGQNYIDAIQSYLEKIAIDKEPQLIRALHICGIGGVGKTYLARRFAYHSFQLNYYNLIWWFDDNKTFEDSIKKLYKTMLAARYLTVEHLTDYQSQFMAIQKALNLMPGKWLLIYDNISDQTLQEQRLFQVTTSGGHILTTARFMKSGHCLTLCEFSPLEAFNYLKRHMIQANYDDGMEDERLRYIAEKLLYCLPLALAQASSYMIAQDMSLNQYIEEFSKNTHGNLVYSCDGEFSIPIYKSLQLTLACLSRQACELFFMLCFLPPDDVPIFIFESLISSKNAFKKVYKELQRQRLITLVGKDDFIFSSMHRLYQFIGKKIFLTGGDEPHNTGQFNTLYQKMIHTWQQYVEPYQKQAVRAQGTREWYLFFKTFTKCIDHLLSEKDFYKRSADKSKEMFSISKKPAYKLQSQIVPIIESILTQSEEGPDFDQLMWEEIGLSQTEGQNLKGIVDEIAAKMNCSKLAIYKLIHRYHLKSPHMLHIAFYCGHYTYLWDLKFLFKVIASVKHSEETADTIYLYTDIIMDQDKQYPGLASALALYVIQKTKTQGILSFRDIHKILTGDIFLELYLKTEQNYSKSMGIEQIEIIEIVRQMRDLYLDLKKNMTPQTVGYYSAILYCYDQFGLNFVLKRLENLEGLEWIYIHRETSDIIKLEDAERIYDEYTQSNENT